MFTPGFIGVRVVQYIVLYIVCCRSTFVLLVPYFWPLYYLSSFDLQLLIAPWYLQTFIASHGGGVSLNIYYFFLIASLSLTVIYSVYN